MEIIHSTEIPNSLPPCVATIGFFDGVHRGHRFLIDRIKDEAGRLGIRSMVITFDKHPRQVLQAEFVPRLLSSPERKLRLLSQTGIDSCVVLHFDREMSQMPARDFMRQLLYGRLNVRKLIMGYDNRFGKRCNETFDDYVSYGSELGMEVACHQDFKVDGVEVSSSVVRGMLAEGKVAEANKFLGYDYAFSGRVVGGYRQGRKMGFPTANISPSFAQQLIPAIGIYAVRTLLPGCDEWWPSMMSVGTNPTFPDRGLTLETHILDFAGDLYGQEIVVSFVEWLRHERKFSDMKELAGALREDEQKVRKIFHLK